MIGILQGIGNWNKRLFVNQGPDWHILDNDQ